MKHTIVTAIYHYSHSSRMGGRNYSFEYYENPFRNLLSLGANIVVFTHASELNKINDFFARNNFTDCKVIEYDLDSYVYSDKIYEIKEKKLIIDKDGLIPGNSFIMNDRNTHLCLSKIDFLAMAIEYFDSDKYYWIDAGLFHNGLIPQSLGGMERHVKPDDTKFWPTNQNNICKPSILNHHNFLFVGLTNPQSVPVWNSTKRVHIIGGIFGGDKNEILKLHPIFRELVGQVLVLGELTLEEDILTMIVEKYGYDYLKFDTWLHDIATDSCYYGPEPGQKSFYKIFLSSTIHVFGDSHCTIFLGMDGLVKTDVCGLDAASITGLNKVVSRLEYGKYIINILENSCKTHYALLKLGQVDMEFIMYYKLYFKKEVFTFEEYCASLINNYREFIRKILLINPNVIIASINLPAYCDGVDIGQYVKRIISEKVVLPKEEIEDCLDGFGDGIDFSIEQVTRNFMFFNGLLQDLAEELGLRFFDTTELFLDDRTGLLKDEYRCCGHHYRGFNDGGTNAGIVTRIFLEKFMF